MKLCSRRYHRPLPNTLLRLPLSSDSLFPDGNKVIAGWSEKVQLATLAALANPTKTNNKPVDRGPRRDIKSGGRGKTHKPQGKDDSDYNQNRNDRSSCHKKPAYSNT